MCAADISELFALSARALSRIRVAVGGVDIAKRRKVKGRREREVECKCIYMCVCRFAEREIDDSRGETEKEWRGRLRREEE